MRIGRTLLLAGFAASIVTALGPAPAGADVLSCEFNPQTRVLSVAFEGATVIERQSGSPNIRVDGIVCAAPDLSANATVQTTDSIVATGTAEDDRRDRMAWERAGIPKVASP